MRGARPATVAHMVRGGLAGVATSDETRQSGPASGQAPTMIDLFAGCGGLTLGFVQAGFIPVLAVERDPAAASTYAANFGGEHVLNEVLQAVPDAALPAADVVVGGPPCQGFSLSLIHISEPTRRTPI